MNSPRSLLLARVWLFWSAYLFAAGLLLSALHQLGTAGYVVVLICGTALLFLLERDTFLLFRPRILPGKFKWRYAHGLPACFLLIACLAALGGILYVPNNYDALCYRFPRILHWLVEHRRHWIETSEARMNYSATGFEWLMLPLFTITGSDRLFFLINTLSFSLLPGLTYATLTRLGLGKRVAWTWMWLLPLGYGYVAEAGSIGSDLIAVTYLLASVCFTLRARETGRISDFFYGLIAVALLTGSKASNIPLLLPWAVATLPSLGLLRRNVMATAAVALLGLSISFVPVACSNLKHTGDWTGQPWSLLKVANPLYCIAGNSLELFEQNAMPSIMPFAQAVNAKIKQLESGPRFRELLRQFPHLDLKCGEVPQEEAAGIGLGLSALLLVTLCFGSLRSGGTPRRSFNPSRKLGILICFSGLFSLAFYMAKLGSDGASRLIAPYYPLVIATVLLVPGAPSLVRQRWWRRLALLAALSSFPVVILLLSRPLWPAVTILGKLSATMPGNRIVERALNAYSVYRIRGDALAPLRRFIGDDTQIGFIGGNDPETSLWRPFGSRRVLDVTVENQWNLAAGTPMTIIASAVAVEQEFGLSLEQWAASLHGRIIGRAEIHKLVSVGPEDWAAIRVGENNAFRPGTPGKGLSAE